MDVFKCLHQPRSLHLPMQQGHKCYQLEKSLGLNGLLDRIDVRNKQDDRQIVHCPRTTHIE